MSKMDKAPSVGLVACGAVHDQVKDGFKQHELPFCHQNVACSHGNLKLLTALKKAQEVGDITKAEAEKDWSTIWETVGKLREIDSLSVYIRLLNEDATRQDIREKVIQALGEDSDQWDQLKKQKQIALWGPIVEIAQKLSSFGFINFDPKILAIDTNAHVEASYTDASHPLIATAV